MRISVIIQVVCSGLFLFKLQSDFEFFQEKVSIFKELVKQVDPLNLMHMLDSLKYVVYCNGFAT